MFIDVYSNAKDFLLKTEPILMRNETLNGLMLGICFRLRKYPERITTAPYLATVEDEGGLVAAACMTPPHNIVLYSDRANDDEALAMLIENLRENNWPVPGALGPASVAEKFAVLWGKLSGQAYRAGIRERLFELDSVIPPQPAPGVLRVATEDDLELVTNWLVAFVQEALPENAAEQAETRKTAPTRVANRDIYLWELPEGTIVSLAAKTRPVVHVISVGPVYTPPEYRGKGYASNCVAALSQLLLESGWQHCSLFTDLANPTSNSIYQKIGYRPVCDFNEFIFE
ncbi:MAG TPA: GNAT family N-acetyltransferase [Ktedonobacteraceae bacterium]|nr:GNAT family N-acetyltransferase [Ktedonobacteraceae bacterium]